MFNVSGAIAWVCIFTIAGVAFGNIPEVKKNFQYVTSDHHPSILPAVIEWWRERNAKMKAHVSRDCSS